MKKQSPVFSILIMILLILLAICAAAWILLPSPQPSSPTRQDSYVPEMQEQVDNINEGLTLLTKLLQSPDFGNQTWTKAILTWAEVIKRSHSNLTTLKPPPVLAHYHLGLTSATKDCNTSMDHLIVGVNNLDSSQFSAAIAPLESCTNKMLASAKELEEFNAK